MAKVKIKFPPSALREQVKAIEKQLQKTQLLDKLSDELIKDMKNGLNPKTGKPFRKIAPSTIKRRKALSKVNKTDSRYSPARSNLTFTGEFLESIKAFFKKKRGGSTITIEPTGTHPGYNLVRGGRSKSVSNSKIAEAQESMGRQVLTFSKKRINSIKVEIQRFLRQKLT